MFNPFVAPTAHPTVATFERQEVSALRRLVEPLVIGGLTVQQILTSTSLLLLERGDVDAAKLAIQLQGGSDDVELNTLAALRRGMRETIRVGGEDE